MKTNHQNHTLHKVQPRCPICGADRWPLQEETHHVCNGCGLSFEADSTCENGHFVCYPCRQKAARQEIITHCLNSTQTDPYALMIELMELPGVGMHGPEHHLLIGAALLTATCNEKGRDDLSRLLEEANERSMQVPGGACGFWGVCGAAIGTGIFTSILTKASPLAQDEWKTTGQLASRCAGAISAQGGPRCCKRDCFTALLEAIPYCNEHLGTGFSKPDITCRFFPNNVECKGTKCPFFPVRNK